MPDHAASPIVLQFNAARFERQNMGVPSLSVDLAARAGEFVVVLTPSRRTAAALADACCGLMPTAAGRCALLGRDWRGCGADVAAALRGQVGRCFCRGGWLGYMGVDDNVLAPQLFHTRRDREDVRDEAAAIAEHFGLPGLPMGRPGTLGADDLQRAMLVRAFLGKPRLVVLERPTGGDPTLAPAVLDAVMRAAEDGAATVLITTPSDPSLLTRDYCDQRFRVRRSGRVEALS